MEERGNVGMLLFPPLYAYGFVVGCDSLGIMVAQTSSLSVISGKEKKSFCLQKVTQTSYKQANMCVIERWSVDELERPSLVSHSLFLLF